MAVPENPSGLLDAEAANGAPNVEVSQATQPGTVTTEDTASNNSSSSMKDISCIYFGYGSNLSPRTMKQRCPDSLFVGLGRLMDWRWVINETGYANIVPSPGDVVYGSLCFLSRRDEMALDESEGVPWLYEKMDLPVTRLVAGDGNGDGWSTAGEVKINAMSYVDVQRKSVGKIEKEYVVWIRKAIEDGVQCGMSKEYAEKYLSPYLPEGKEQVSTVEDVVMVRTTRFGEHSAGLVPRGFASWSRG